ncbi:MAG: PAS domain S-box protein [Candidatus Kariarchaeaceae archaeon]
MHVMYVDDESSLLEIGKTFLEKINPEMQIITCASAKEGFMLLKEKKIDIIISDYQMPLMNGLEFLKTVRTNGYLIPFIIFTGRGREEVAIKAINLGANRYIQKGTDVKAQYKVLAQAISDEYEFFQAQHEIIYSEKAYRSLVESMNDGLAQTSDSRCLSFVNTSLLKMLGYTAVEMLGKPILSFFDEKNKAIIEENRSKGNPTYEVEWIGKNRKVITELTVYRSFNEEGVSTGTVSIAKDITESKRLLDLQKLVLIISRRQIGLRGEEVAEGIQQGLEELGSFCGADIAYVYLRSSLKKETVTLENSWRREGIANLKNFEIISTDLLPWFMSKLRNDQPVVINDIRTIASDANKDLELISLSGMKSLVAIPNIVNGKLNSSLVMVSLTKEIAWKEKEIQLFRMAGEIFSKAIGSQKTEKIIIAHEMKFLELAEIIPTGLAMIDIKGFFTYVNGFYCEMLEYSKEELIGTKHFDYLVDESKLILGEQLKKRMKGDDTHYELVWLSKSGKEITTKMISKPKFNIDGEYEGSYSIIIIKDIEK